MTPVKLIKSLIVLVLLGLLVSCEPPESAVTEPGVAVGTHAYVKIFGNHYKAEVTSAHEGYVVWSYSWKNTPVFKFKTYRGLMTVYSEEEGYKSSSTFDRQAIDNFFPIAAGKELTLEGMTWLEKEGVEYSYWATVSVREKAKIKIKDTKYNVYIIDYSFIEDHPEGPKNYTKTVWYSPEFETSLRTDYVLGDEVFSMRMVAFNSPEEIEDTEDREPEGLGTVRL